MLNTLAELILAIVILSTLSGTKPTKSFSLHPSYSTCENHTTFSKILRSMKYADLALAVSLGFAIGLAYSDVLTSAIVGDYAKIILSLLYLTCCVLYPMYGYVPEVDREGALILLMISMLAVYILPVIAVLSLGMLISLRSIESVFLPTIRYYKGIFGFPVISGFIVGAQYGDVDVVKFCMLFIPSLVCLAWFIWSGFSESDYTEESPIFSREEMLGVHLSKVPIESDIRQRGG